MSDNDSTAAAGGASHGQPPLDARRFQFAELVGRLLAEEWRRKTNNATRRGDEPKIGFAPPLP